MQSIIHQSKLYRALAGALTRSSVGQCKYCRPQARGFERGLFRDFEMLRLEVALLDDVEEKSKASDALLFLLDISFIDLCFKITSVRIFSILPLCDADVCCLLFRSVPQQPH